MTNDVVRALLRMTGLILGILLAVDDAVALAGAPKLVDARLEITLFAEDPEIVTPIGMAIDDQDRLFVIESHTHHPPDDYQGPDGDRIKIFVDDDDDGRADRVSVFAEGIQQAMNLGFSPQGELFVVCAREVWRLVDEDQDGVCDRRDSVLKLETEQRYAHNSMLSLTFDRDGWMYLGRGNTGSDAYRLVGADGTVVEGFGDGGSIIRCRPDGTQLSEFATGFWNPFDLKFDRWGQLLLVDNDPDARGPNRLLKVVRGGDYGYKSMFGGAGTHPFQGWDGTLPGTLPYIAGTGEAPSGLIDCRRSSFPSDYQHSILATIWNENSIERFELDPKTSRLTNKSVFLSGDQEFRPVALDCDRSGNLFLTDWVLVDYPNHGRGRIWRISPKNRDVAMKPEGYFDAYHPSETQERLTQIAKLDKNELMKRLTEGETGDPFVRHAVEMRLAESDMQSARQACFDGEADLRMIGLLAAKRAEPKNTALINRFLLDPDPEIRRAALMWAGQSGLLSVKDQLQRALSVEPVTPIVFEAYLAATEVLTEEFLEAYQSRRPAKASKLPRSLNLAEVIEVAKKEAFPEAVRALAIKRFDEVTVRAEVQFVLGLLNQGGDELAIAAIDVLAATGQAKQHVGRLAELVRDSRRSASVRTHALAALGKVGGIDRQSIKRLQRDPDQRVAKLAQRIQRSAEDVGAGAVGRPATNDEWRSALAEGGDPLLGRHVFSSTRVGCSKCHSMDGRGGTLGPSLRGLAASKSRAQIVEAILDPSKDFAPQYQAWMVLTVDGAIYRGLQLDHKAKGAIVLTLDDGNNRYFEGSEVEAYQAMPKSLMPSGLEKLMSVDEFRDLVAYLSSF